MLIDAIKAIINPDVAIEVINHNGQGTVILEEKGQDAKLKKVTLRGFDAAQTFAFKLDVEGKRISDYLNPAAEKINKSCDGIIFTCFKNKEYVFICELKSGKPVKKEYLRQFRNSHVFVKYINHLLEEFYSLNFRETVSVKYILFDKHQKNKLNKTKIKAHKIEPEEILSEDNHIFSVYKIHHLSENEFLNIRHLKLD
ncbi:MAG TPA: hypothetical protein DCM38_13485 [Gammaproteobacteria bacterium]|nr:hypothetical protein [Candidatus Parabeggiatoa sp.]HAI70434.1 hypothetical protein [Gammaproteobacteria bacterium]